MIAVVVSWKKKIVLERSRRIRSAKSPLLLELHLASGRWHYLCNSPINRLYILANTEVAVDCSEKFFKIQRQHLFWSIFLIKFRVSLQFCLRRESGNFAKYVKQIFSEPLGTAFTNTHYACKHTLHTSISSLGFGHIYWRNP